MWRALFVAFCAVLFSQLDADLTTTIAAMVRPDAAAFNDRVVWITGASSGNIALNIVLWSTTIENIFSRDWSRPC